MNKYFRRALETLMTLIGVSIVAFFLIRLVPGDPVTLLIGERGAAPEVIAELKAKLGLDQSLTVQYFKFLKQILHGDFGTSILSGRPVLDEFLEKFTATAELSVVALFLASLIGVTMGVVAALKKGSWLDRLMMTGAVTFYSMPIFWWGLVAISIFSVKLGWLPVSGRTGVEFDINPRSGFYLLDSLLQTSTEDGEKWKSFLDVIWHLLLPAFVLMTVPLAVIARMTRSSLLEVFREEYIRAAYAKGYSAFRVVVRHALRNALIPVVTVIGLMAGTLLTGAILTETLFSWPGLGRWLVSAVLARDYPVIQGGILFIAGLVIMTSILVDAVLFALSPRLRGQK